MSLPPVFWSPSDLAGPDSDGEVGRRGQTIKAIVHHRVVGTLESMTNSTFKPSADPALTPGERRVSSHFGIGFWGTELRIVQYVALENTAYCNGQTEKDIAALLSTRPWSVYSQVRQLAGGHVSANYFTVSIEHEDNGAAGKYVVVEAIVAASIELDRLLLTGDGPRIRAAGIRCSDSAAKQLGAIEPLPDTLVDHNVCAPVTKPYCWRRIGDDKGFPQARYLLELTAALEEPDMPGLALRLLATVGDKPLSAFGTATVKGTGISLIRARDMALVPVADGLNLGAVQLAVLTSPLEAQRGRPTVAGDRTNVVAFNAADEQHVALRMDVAFALLPAPIPNCGPAVEAATAPLTTKLRQINQLSNV